MSRFLCAASSWRGSYVSRSCSNTGAVLPGWRVEESVSRAYEQRVGMTNLGRPWLQLGWEAGRLWDGGWRVWSCCSESQARIMGWEVAGGGRRAIGDR